MKFIKICYEFNNQMYFISIRFKSQADIKTSFMNWIFNGVFIDLIPTCFSHLIVAKSNNLLLKYSNLIV